MRTLISREGNKEMLGSANKQNKAEIVESAINEQLVSS